MTDYTDLIDRVLADKSPAVKARVLDLVRKQGIDDQEDFWLVFIALNHLQVYVEQIPNTLADFQEHLDQWQDSNLSILEALSEKASTVETLALSSKELGSTAQTLAQSCTTLVKRLQTSDQSLISSIKAVQRSSRDADSSIKAFEISTTRQLTSLASTLSTATHQMDRSMASHRGFRSKLPWVLSMVSVVAMVILGWQQYQTQLQLQTLRQQSEWQLSNILNMACTFGAKPMDAPECQ
ncbi:MAG: DUF6753 family protein [Cyanobacteria bacterium J06629_9]